MKTSRYASKWAALGRLMSCSRQLCVTTERVEDADIIDLIRLRRPTLENRMAAIYKRLVE
jgi:hypothetical protein